MVLKFLRYKKRKITIAFCGRKAVLATRRVLYNVPPILFGLG